MTLLPPVARRYNERRAAFAEQGATIIAGAVDDLAKTSEVAEGLEIPVAYGVLATKVIYLALGGMSDGTLSNRANLCCRRMAE